MLKIIDQQYPYYCVIEHPEQSTIIEQGLDILDSQRYESSRGDITKFRHCRLLSSDTAALVRLSPLKFLFPFCSKPYASIFSTAAGHYYRPHKDGLTIRFALNYMLDVKDDCCRTNWYSDQLSGLYNVDTLDGRSRELENFNKSAHQPWCSTVFKKNQCVLFNTDKYHDFDNSLSKNSRHLLTIRFSSPENFYWEDALLILTQQISKSSMENKNV